MNINFELILVLATLLAGLLWLVDALFFARQRQRSGATKAPLIFEYARSFFPILLIVVLIRSFLLEPFRIPSGSLEPTLLPGDFILVNKYDYGLRLPVLHTKFLPISAPKVGDIIVFRWPPNPGIDYIKRVIGVPGDHISYINKVLYINGKKAKQQPITTAIDSGPEGYTWPVQENSENLSGVKHDIYLRPNVAPRNFTDIVVPKGEYFVMGDNRDDSQDSRYWGFVPEKNIIGKAVMIWFSWNKTNYGIRWHRIGERIH